MALDVLRKQIVMKSNISNKWLVLKHGVEKYLIKNFDLFVPSSAGNYKLIGKYTERSINLTFPLIYELLLSQKTISPKLKNITNLFGSKNNKNVKKLESLFKKYGSDKSSSHDYHKIYGALFKNKRKVKKVLEIGLGTNNINIPSNMGIEGKPGASVRAFRDFFDNAIIFGADIDRKTLFRENRIKTFYLDQTKTNSLSQFFKKFGKFDLIVDDGLHVPYANLNVLISSLNYLSDQGFIIIEDIPFKARPIWEIVSFILSKKYHNYLIKTKNSLIFLVKKK